MFKETKDIECSRYWRQQAVHKTNDTLTDRIQ